MHRDLLPLTSAADVDRLIDESTATPVLLFKHSYTCGTSAQAMDELIEHLDSEGRHPIRYAVVTVQTHRDVSTHIAARLGLRHETPQAILVRHGKVVWAASHFRVTADAMARAIETYGGTYGTATV